VLYSYSSFDCLWWGLIAYLMIRLLTTDNPRWGLAIGAAIGLGMMTKYTISFLVVGLVIGVLLTPARRQLRSPWLWAGVALALLIVLPNLIWHVRHHFISWDFMQGIHARDVRIGRAEGYLPEQLVFSANPVTIPLWAGGLVFFFSPMGKRFRVLGWMYLVPFVLFFFSQGRSYYIAPAYPMLFAGGAVLFEAWLARFSAARGRLVRWITGLPLPSAG
jgi:4-amino-4-deoxy-L-arabinose transferase-like glycosyltransferase